MRRIAVIHAPSILGLRPTGLEKLPEALEAAGLSHRLGARFAGRVEPPAYSADRDPITGFLNAVSIAGYTQRLASLAGDVLDAGEFPLVLGGDCSILLGPMLALHPRGRHGLLFLDGHMDFYQPEANVNGEAASSDLALATGHGPALLTTYSGRCPLVHERDVAAFGFRDQEEAQSYGSQPLPPQTMAISLQDVRREGATAAAHRAIRHVSGDGSHGYWIHLDADVLDDAIMPCVDYRIPDGLTWAEIGNVLGAALAQPQAIGMEVTIFNPTLDRDGSVTKAFVEMLASALAVAL